MCLTSCLDQLLSGVLSFWQLPHSLVEVATDAALCANKCVTGSWPGYVAELRNHMER